MIAIQPKSRQILGVNQQAYKALKAAMSLNLRRQLLVAVCDNVILQNQLATQLENDLAQISWRPPREGSAASGGGSLALERLVFDPEDAHLPRQVAHWVRQTMLEEGALPQVQVLGIEQMTRQPAMIQNHFLRSLEQVEALLPRLNTSLLVWVPWPWLRTIQSSAPTFWKWRNGVFEFVSEPTPTLPSPDLRAPSTGRYEADSVNGNRKGSGDRPKVKSAINIEDYPHIDPHQVVALYGETDDSDMSDYGQPTLETIATWDTVDVIATTVRTSEDSAEASSEPSALGQIEAQDVAVTQEQTQYQDGQKTVLEDVATFELQDVQTARKSDATINSDVSGAMAAPTKEAPLSEPQSLEADRIRQTQWLADQQQAQQRLNEQQLAAEQEAAELELAQSLPVQDLPAQASPVQELPTQSQSTPDHFGQTEVAQTEKTLPTQSAFGYQSKRNSIQSASAVKLQQEQRQRAADDYFEVGHRYRSRIEAGERGLEIIEPAIAAYEGALRCLSGPHPDWGSGLNDLGTLYWLKAQQLDDEQQVLDCMNHSIELYSQALTKIESTESPDMACQLYSNLGAVYSMLATQDDPVTHFKQAADAYLKALPFCPMEADPQEFATLQNSLGSVYWKLSHYEQEQQQLQQYLQQAITAYERAAMAYVPQASPLDYAAVQNNLGITYWSLAKHKDAVPTLKSAIAAYRDALNYRTPETDAAACAITYNNLALAYWDLSKDDTIEGEHKLRYQRNAVTAFEAALQTSNGVGALSKVDSAAIYHCLGDVHAQMVEGVSGQKEIADSLQKSLHSYVQAIDEVSMESPIFQARLTAIVANLKSHRERLGLASQQAALNRVPSHLVSLVMQAL